MKLPFGEDDKLLPSIVWRATEMIRIMKYIRYRPKDMSIRWELFWYAEEGLRRISFLGLTTMCFSDYSFYKLI